MRGHGACIGIGPRKLRISLAVQLLLELTELAHLLAKPLDLLAQPAVFASTSTGWVRSAVSIDSSTVECFPRSAARVCRSWWV
jgi:hypothetical protein